MFSSKTLHQFVNMLSRFNLHKCNRFRLYLISLNSLNMSNKFNTDQFSKFRTIIHPQSDNHPKNLWEWPLTKDSIWKPLIWFLKCKNLLSRVTALRAAQLKIFLTKYERVSFLVASEVHSIWVALLRFGMMTTMAI